MSESARVPAGDVKTAAEMEPASLPEQIPTQRESLWRRIFFGPGGLRPGWGLLLFAMLLIGFSRLASVVLHRLHPTAAKTVEQRRHEEALPQTAKLMLTVEGVSFGVLVLTSWIMSRVERRRLGQYGFGGERKAGRFLAGFGWGLIFLGALVGALWKAGLLVFDGRLLFGDAVWKQGLVWVAGFVLVGLFEEYLLRGYLQFTLARGFASLYRMLFGTEHGDELGFWTSAAVLSFLFGLGHGNNPGESPVGLWSAGLIGLIFCLTLWRTGSLWWALGFHAAWDWMQSFVFGVADSGMMVQGHLMATRPVGRVLWSGGATGPEGSALILPLLLVLTGVVMVTLRGRKWTAA